MLLVFLLLLPLVIIPFLVESDSKWFRRFAFVIAGVQLIVMLFRHLPEDHTRVFSAGSFVFDQVQFIKTVVVHLF